MNVNTTIHGYVVDGSFYHPSCAERVYGAAWRRLEFSARALFGPIDSDDRAVVCDQCLSPIFV